MMIDDFRFSVYDRVAGQAARRIRRTHDVPRQDEGGWTRTAEKSRRIIQNSRTSSSEKRLNGGIE